MKRLALAFLLLAACGDTAPRTQVTVFVRAEDGARMDSDRLEVAIRGGPAAGVLEDRELLLFTDASSDEGHALSWPVRIALVPIDGDAARRYEVTATASGSGALVAQTRVVSGYLQGETLTLDVWLRDDCRGVTCGASETCAAGACVPVPEVDPCLLERLEGGGRSGMCAPVDAGPDASPMDSGEPDAASMDAWVQDEAGVDAATMDGGAIDGSSDAGPDARVSPLEVHNVVFVTSTPMAPGALMGLAGADAHCQMLATAAGLPRPTSYVAFLSTSTVDARSRIAPWRGWVRVDGLPFVDTVDDLADGHIYYPVTLAENDLSPTTEFVATATDPNLLGVGGNCVDYTSTTGSLSRIGNSREGPVRWVNVNTGLDCSTPRSLYCFGTGQSRPLDPLPAPPLASRRGFLSNATIRSGPGLAAFDALCQREADAARYVGIFMALVPPNASTSAVSRLTVGDPWYRPDGVLIASDIPSISNEDLVAPIAVTTLLEYADYRIWSGGGSPGTAGTRLTCGGWDSPVGPTYIGSAGSAVNFFRTDASLCGAMRRLLCLER